MPKTIAVEDIANIRILVGGKAISPSRIQIRDGTLTIAMQKSSLAQLGQERPWYGVGGFQSLIYALVDTGIERPLILSRYLATSRDSVAVTMKYMADAGDLIRIRKGHYVTAERDAKGMTDRFWMQVLDSIYRQYGYLSVDLGAKVFEKPGERLIPAIYVQIQRDVDKKLLFWSQAMHMFNRTLAFILLSGKYRPTVQDDEIYYQQPYAAVHT